MAEYQSKIYNLPANGKMTLSSDGRNLSCKFERGDKIFEENVVALPNHRRDFKVLGNQDQIKPNDIIVFKYPGRFGYAEVVDDVYYESGKAKLKTIPPDGVLTERNDLLSNSSYDPKSQTFHYNGPWEPNKGQMSFSIVRTKGRAADNSNAYKTSQTVTDEANPSQEKRELSAFNAAQEKYEDYYAEFLKQVVARRKAAGDRNPDLNIPASSGLWKNIRNFFTDYAAFKNEISQKQQHQEVRKNWREVGKSEYHRWSDAQERLETFNKYYKKDLSNLTTWEERTSLCRTRLDSLRHIGWDLKLFAPY